jgi:hypothetical protein
MEERVAGGHSMSPNHVHSGEADDSLFRRLTLPEEDRRQYTKPISWSGCWRWFRSPNVIDLYHYRDQDARDRIRRVLFGVR